ncbi:hypothetical protein DSAG12_03149 [Promethearchaeum syntrophicum]|uniref:Uncharacterized protein n=1 Tax=Promethearchaeum syntrophicum TaxID=2594042 RepID=A0A5B9DF07_9ARCH|nr:hypothetical protein [Candidatus Prometheoarchaeum syntrophicum]
MSNSFEKKSDSNDISKNVQIIDSPVSSDILVDEYTGIGQSLDLLHNANRTDSDIDLTFTNGSQASHQIPLGENWEGTKLNSDITNLRDTRNWVNGTFNYGNDDGTYLFTEDDSVDIQNSFQNWTFSDIDTGTANLMSGNYYDSASSTGRDALELVMEGNAAQLAGYYSYHEGDYCQWNSTFNIDRGQIEDSNLNFQANPNYLANFNSWEIRFYVDTVMIYSIGTYSLKNYGESLWHDFSIPMGIWVNTTNVFTSQLNETSHSIAVRLQYIATDASYSDGFTHISHQQVFLANIELEVKASVKAEQIGLKMNTNSILSSDFGVGTISQLSSWTTTPVYANFTADDSPYYDYTVDFNSDFNLYAQKTSPTTNYETNSGSPGTSFSIANASDANWEFYSYFSVPTGYAEENFTLYFPSDWTITWVSTPQLPTDNNITECDISKPGQLIIPVNNLSATPDGFWKFNAQSPNYIQNLVTSKNTTGTPGPSDWSVNNTYFSGEYLNITAQVKTSGVNFTDLSSTHANLDIFFPNGTKWISKSEEIAVLADGTIQFSPIQIPENGPDYIVGDYDVFVSWNNTDGINPINETGMAYTHITIKHYSILIPDDDFIDHFIEGSTTSLRINFFDIVSGEAIESATLTFLNLTNGLQTLNEIAPGYYFTELTAPSINPGNNTLNIEASHPLYASTSSNIVVEVELKTILDVEEFPRLTVALNQSFIINLNFKEETSGLGITGCNIDVTWEDNFIVNEINNGDYQIHCNNTNTGVNQIYSIEITASKYGFEQKTILNEIKIRQIETNITSINQNNSFTILPGRNFDPTIFIEDLDYGGYVEGCEVTFTWKYGEGEMEESNPGEYSTNLRNIQEGIYTIDIFVYKEGGNYNFQKFQMTLNVIAPQEGGIPAFLLYIMGVLMVGLIGMFIAYQQHFKYPKIIREIRSLNKAISKGKGAEKVLSVKNADELFIEDYKIRTKGTLPSRNKSLLKVHHIPISDQKSITKGDVKKNFSGEKPPIKESQKKTPKIPKVEKKLDIEGKLSSLEENLELPKAEQPKKVGPIQKIEKLKPDQFVKPNDIENGDLQPISKDQKPKKIRYLRKPKIKELPKKKSKKPKKD